MYLGGNSNDKTKPSCHITETPRKSKKLARLTRGQVALTSNRYYLVSIRLLTLIKLDVQQGWVTTQVTWWTVADQDAYHNWIA